MVPSRTYCDNLALAQSVRHVDGCVVECGVWRGGMSAGLASVLGRHRQYFLLDSFQGLPPAGDIDGDAARQWQRDVTSPFYFDNCSAPEEFAREAMTLADAPHTLLVAGWFADTLPSFDPGPIVLLRLDGDWYESTTLCLERLFDRVVPGGLVILDDYFAWDGCSRAVHDFLSRRSAVERLRSFGTVCYFSKAPVTP